MGFISKLRFYSWSVMLGGVVIPRGAQTAQRAKIFDDIQ